MELGTATVPIFPLPNLVFFPQSLLPLHIFEPRYKEMVSDALSGDGQLGIVQLRPGWEKDYYGTPPVYRVMGIGRIADSTCWTDGRYDIVLEGTHRAQILSEGRRGEYRVAQIKILEDYVPIEAKETVDREYPHLLKIFNNLVRALPKSARGVLPQALTNPPAGVLADMLACLFADNAYEKQCILNELDVARRIQLVKVQMKNTLEITRRSEKGSRPKRQQE